jgi:hypothetical protein
MAACVIPKCVNARLPMMSGRATDNPTQPGKGELWGCHVIHYSAFSSLGLQTNGQGVRQATSDLLNV